MEEGTGVGEEEADGGWGGGAPEVGLEGKGGGEGGGFLWGYGDELERERVHRYGRVVGHC